MIIRRVDIYIPSGYENDSLPALYLIHGINGYEGSWQDLGYVIDTLKAQMADGRCRPMMLVMPDCNKWPIKKRPISHGNLWKCLTHYSALSHEHDLELAVSDLIDMVDSTYRVTTCAIAGLSDGARMAANVANARPDRVRTIGLFSPVLHKDQLPKDSTQTYYIYVGKSDLFYASGNRFHKNMTRANRPHEFIEREKAGHNWRMWQFCVSDMLQKLSFREPSMQPVHTCKTSEP